MPPKLLCRSISGRSFFASEPGAPFGQSVTTGARSAAARRTVNDRMARIVGMLRNECFMA
jgi:hypothetical protein